VSSELILQNKPVSQLPSSELVVTSNQGLECLRRALKIADLHVEDEHSSAFDLSCLILGNFIDLGLASDLVRALAPPAALPSVTHEEFAFIKLLDGRLESSGPPKDPALLADLAALFKRTYDLATDVIFGFRARISELPAGIPADWAPESGEHDTDALILLLRCFGRMAQTLSPDLKEGWAKESEFVGQLIGGFLLTSDLVAEQDD
jgi:hypothetical protein